MPSKPLYKVLCVCLGNICRSPTAEAILRHYCAAHGLNVLVDSAGISNCLHHLKNTYCRNHR